MGLEHNVMFVFLLKQVPEVREQREDGSGAEAGGRGGETHD